MNVHKDVVQQSEEWFRVRKGRPTASQAERILTPTGKESSQWEKYAIELIAETIRPDELPAFAGNAHTDRGNELEPEARETFADLLCFANHGLELTEVGFVTRADGIVGCSPDALVYKGETPVAGVELKCPMAKTHAGYILDGELPATYRPQVHFSMAVTGLPWYFMSYCPGMVPHLVKVPPDAYTRQMAQAIDRFLIYYAEQRRKWIPILTGKGGSK